MMQIRPKKCNIIICSAWMISYILHPVFIPFYVLLIFFLISHFFFYDIEKIIKLIFLSAVIVPLLIQYLLYRLKILRSFFLVQWKARIGFTLLMAFIYYLLFTTLHPVSVLNHISLFFRGITVSLLISAGFNMFKKRISLHALALGGALFFLLKWSHDYKTNILDIISAAITLTTLTLAARIKLNAHNITEIAIGLLTGIAGQTVSFFIL